MAEGRGCFKTGCLGCLGVLGIGVVFLGITSIVAWNGARDKDVVDQEVAAPLVVPQVLPEVETEGLEVATPEQVAMGGKLVLNLSQGEFQIFPAEPGQGLTIKANFDDDIFNLEDKFETLPDGTWVYQVRFYRTIGGMQAMLRQLMGGGHNNSVHVFIPADMPIELVIDSEEGGFEADLGGLWLTSADIKFSKGGFALEISEPLKEPMESLLIHSNMGGFDAEGIGNASPAVLGVRCSMGGGQVGLDGQWLNDCSARISVKMGGMAVVVPDDVVVEGADVQGDGMSHTDGEVALPVIRMSVSQSMGEVEVVR